MQQFTLTDEDCEKYMFFAKHLELFKAKCFTFVTTKDSEEKTRNYEFDPKDTYCYIPPWFDSIGRYTSNGNTTALLERTAERFNLDVKNMVAIEFIPAEIQNKALFYANLIKFSYGETEPIFKVLPKDSLRC